MMKAMSSHLSEESSARSIASVKATQIAAWKAQFTEDNFTTNVNLMPISENVEDVGKSRSIESTRSTEIDGLKDDFSVGKVRKSTGQALPLTVCNRDTIKDIESAIAEGRSLVLELLNI